MNEKPLYVDAHELTRRVRVAVWGLVITGELAAAPFLGWVQVDGRSQSFWALDVEGQTLVAVLLAQFGMLGCLACGVVASAEARYVGATAAWVTGLVTLLLVTWLVSIPDDGVGLDPGALPPHISFGVFVGFFFWVSRTAPGRWRGPQGPRSEWMDPDFGTIDKRASRDRNR